MYQTSICIFITSLFYGSLCKNQNVHQLVFSIRNVTGVSVLLQLEEMKDETLTGCTLTQFVKGSKKATILPNILPTNNAFILTDLKPDTQYDINVNCYDTNNITLSTGTATFLTDTLPGNNTYGPESSSVTSAATRLPVMSIQPHTTTVAGLRTVVPTEASWQDTKTLEGGTSMPARDIWLGLALGLLGIGGFICGGYYVLKEYRRRMRIRRFLQYRQQENEAFPDMEFDDDDGALM